MTIYKINGQTLGQTYNIDKLRPALRKKVERLYDLAQRYDESFTKSLLRADERAIQFGKNDSYFKQTVDFADKASEIENHIGGIFEKYGVKFRDASFEKIMQRLNQQA